MEDTQVKVSMDQPFFGVGTGSSETLPSMESEYGNNNKSVLIFSSMNAARRYCYVRCPDKIEEIFEFSRKHEGTRVIQVEMIRAARKAKRHYPNVTGFVLDHPGTGKGKALYIPIDDMCVLGMEPADTPQPYNFEDLIDRASD